MPLPADIRTQIENLAGKAETPRSALVPALWRVQKHFGWLSEQSMAEVAGILKIPPASVQNAATFYTMFFTKPVGRHVVWVCGTLPCALKGAEDAMQYLGEKLGISCGQTTPDGLVTLMEAECLASCGTAPVMLVDSVLHGNLTRQSVDKILRDLKET